MLKQNRQCKDASSKIAALHELPWMEKGRKKRETGIKWDAGKRERWMVQGGYIKTPVVLHEKEFCYIKGVKVKERKKSQAELQDLWFFDIEDFLIWFQQFPVANSMLYNLKNDSWGQRSNFGNSELPGLTPRIWFSYFSSSCSPVTRQINRKPMRFQCVGCIVLFKCGLYNLSPSA